MAGLRRHLARLGILSEVKLAGLDAEAVLQLVRYLAHRLQVVTGGNPFFLLEILRALVETGGLPVHLASYVYLHLGEYDRALAYQEVNKPAGEQGTYLYPEGYGQPPEMGLDYQRNRDLLERPETKPLPTSGER